MDYKKTLNLPKTSFSMKANLPVKEKLILEKWDKVNLYQSIRKLRKGKKSYILHDGPPFANGDIHLGHVLNKTLKDFVIRFQNMRGLDAPYIPGWDCHGLPIEHEVTKKQGSVEDSPIRIRKKSKAYAEKYIRIQSREFQRLGVLGDWQNPYLTMNPAYEAEILRALAVLFEKGLVYQGLRPVYWSTGCRTALAEAEIEYEDRTDTAVYVKFQLTESEFVQSIRRKFNQEKSPVHLVIWTTTPWTLPANQAVALHPGLKYAFVADDESILLIAEKRIPDLERIMSKSLKIQGDCLFSGETIVSKKNLTYRHDLFDKEHGLSQRTRGAVLADYVSAESGTGLVHIAPGHGHEDYEVGKSHGLEIFSPVDDQGRLTEDAGIQSLEGKYVFDADKDIIALLKAKKMLLAEEPITHSYPHCWRSKTPIVFRAVKQWFIRVDAFRGKALDLIDKVKWTPAWGIKRIRGSVEQRFDWCISRQRYWGVPIPVFYDAAGEAKSDGKTIRKFADKVEKKGSDYWYETSDDVLARELGLKTGLKKGMDTLDVWIDSGVSFQAVLEKSLKFPADMYLEGSDQHRGWFQSSLLMACATKGVSPYRSVLTHGFVVDQNGKKMSKSVGNVIRPQDVMKQLGADILRLWVVSSDYTEDIRVSEDITSRVSDAYRKIRNTFRFVIGNLHAFEYDRDRLPVKELIEIDRWALSRLASLTEEATRAHEQNQYHRFFQMIYSFCVKEMSSLYFDILKDRLYTDARNSTSGRSCRTVLFHILSHLTRLLAPVLVFTCDEVWSEISFRGKKESVHLEDWPKVDASWKDPEVLKRWSRILGIRDDVLKALEDKREKKEIGNSLEADVELAFAQPDDSSFFEAEARQLEMLLLVSRIRVSALQDSNGLKLKVTVKRASGLKCARCWNYRDDVGLDRELRDLCQRCAKVVRAT